MPATACGKRVIIMNSKYTTYGDVVNRDRHAKAAARNNTSGTIIKEEPDINNPVRKIVCVAAKPAHVPVGIIVKRDQAAHGIASPASAPTGGIVIKREQNAVSEASGSGGVAAQPPSYVAAGIVIKGYAQPTQAPANTVAESSDAVETDVTAGEGGDYEFVSDDTAFNAWLQSTYYIDSSCTSFNSRGF